MKKTWSITTTLRNPQRLRGFLIVLQQLEGLIWDIENQEKYQILLIKERVYGYGSSQFYNGLSKEQVNLIDNKTKQISLEKAKDIFYTKEYEDPAMRGRQSINPLKKLGFVKIEKKKVTITELGKLFVEENYDIGEIFLKSFLKWQLPNPLSRGYSYSDGYDIKPFIGVLHLINKVNKLCKELKEKPKGITKQEFSLFAITLVNYKDIDCYAQKLIDLRLSLKNKTREEKRTIFESYRFNHIRGFLNSENPKHIRSLIGDLDDYGDNAIRYFRLTRYIYIRGNGFYVDLEPRRKIEIENLLNFDTSQSIKFTSSGEYLEYISNIKEPKLPWENIEKYKEIISVLISDIRSYENKLNHKQIKVEEVDSQPLEMLKLTIAKLREYRRELQEEDNHIISQNINSIKKYIDILNNIYSYNDRPLLLEKYITLGLHALNDAIKIHPNYPVGDDNEPTFTAPAGKADIECYYQSFNCISEVTMLTSRDQWYNEGQPVMRHLRDFENKNENVVAYCIFIAPRIHRDTLNTFWLAVKYEYEGHSQKIIPLTINDFISILFFLIELKNKNITITNHQIKKLYDDIIDSSCNALNAHKWLELIPNIILNWKSQFRI